MGVVDGLMRLVDGLMRVMDGLMPLVDGLMPVMDGLMCLVDRQMSFMDGLLLGNTRFQPFIRPPARPPAGRVTLCAPGMVVRMASGLATRSAGKGLPALPPASLSPFSGIIRRYNNNAA
jgi:hypothetical protein